MANEPAPRPPEKVLHDKESQKSEIDPPETPTSLTKTTMTKTTKEMITLAKRKNRKTKISKLTI